MIQLRANWQDRQSWDAFVERHPHARYCHLFGYGQAVACYRYKPCYIGFVRNGELIAALPTMEISSHLLSKRLVSQPFSEFGGMLVDAGVTHAEFNEIVALLSEYLHSLPGVKLIELHGNHGVADQWHDHFVIGPDPHFIGFLPLTRDTDKLWNEVIRYSARKPVNQAIQYGIEVVRECDERILRERFFPLYLRSMKRLGVPPHDLSYYLDTFRAMGERMHIFWAYHEGQPIAGLLGFSCGKRVNIVNTVSDPEYWRLRPNDLLHWEFIKWAAQSGFDYFDFGSIRYDGQLTFKKKWGCEMAEHKHYFFVANEAKKIGLAVNSSSQGMKRISGVWSNYVPLQVGRVVGPMIRRELAR